MHLNGESTFWILKISNLGFAATVARQRIPPQSRVIREHAEDMVRKMRIETGLLKKQLELDIRRQLAVAPERP